MNQDLRSFLKDAGYLDSPAERLIWSGATPSLRGHLRLLAKLTLLGGFPLALLLASITTLQGSDRLILFGLYAVLVALALLVVDGAFAILLRIGKLERLSSSTLWVYGLPVLLTPLLFRLGLSLIQVQQGTDLPGRFLLWLALLLVSFLLASVPRYLLINRLYWHGVRPPNYRATGWLVLAACATVALLHLLTEKPDRGRPQLTAQARPGLMLLCFDLPDDVLQTYRSALPDWASETWTRQEKSPTDFWAGLGTGTPFEAHRASLYFYRSPLFKGLLSGDDPTQRLFLALLTRLDLAQPLAGNGRYRKYAWEILADYSLPTYALGHWFSFPASCQNGGILSERWRPGLNQPPYLCGLGPLLVRDRLDLHLGGAARALEDRENQIWAQLTGRVATADYALATAYFPLSDNLEHLAEPRRGQVQVQILQFRLARLSELLRLLGEDAAVGIVLATGKTNRGNRQVHFLGNSPWRHNVTPQLDTYLQLAPTILNYFGLPADYLMYKSADPPPQKSGAAVDYGEPYRPQSSNDQLDTRYYQELKSLGYIQ